MCRYQAERLETRQRPRRTGVSRRPSTDQQRNSGETNLSRTCSHMDISVTLVAYALRASFLHEI